VGEGTEGNGSAGSRGGHPFCCAPLRCRRPYHLERQPSLPNSRPAGKDNAATFTGDHHVGDEGQLGPSADERPGTR